MGGPCSSASPLRSLAAEGTISKEVSGLEVRRPAQFQATDVTPPSLMSQQQSMKAESSFEALTCMSSVNTSSVNRLPEIDIPSLLRVSECVQKSTLECRDLKTFTSWLYFSRKPKRREAVS